MPRCLSRASNVVVEDLAADDLLTRMRAASK